MPRSSIDVFERQLPTYVQEVRAANSEVGKAFAFLQFVRRTFTDVDAGEIGALVPDLERFVRVQAGTVIIKGRIDALLGNLVIEFKTSLDSHRLRDARDQLKRYLAALWIIDRQRTNYMLMVTDGVRFKVYKPTAPLALDEASPDDVALEEINEMDLTDVAPEEAFRWLDRYVLWQERIPPTADEMASRFGTQSPVFATVTGLLHQAWEAGRSEASAPQREWSRYLSVVYGSPAGDVSLFLRHTYLATLAKLMTYIYYSSGALPSREKVQRVLSGEAFREWGIENFLEEDFFSWIARGQAQEIGLALAWELLKVLERYDLSRLDEDVLKGLYQDLVDPEDRHDLGEYYTPDWLAEWIVDQVLEEPQATTLDPACGSGTFLASAIRKKLADVKATPTHALQHVLESVKGIDVHPLAVLISKANYLMALGDLVKFKTVGIHIPVYLANSIDFPTARRDVVHGIEVFRYPIDDRTSLAIPRAAVDGSFVGELIETMAQFARLVADDTLQPEPELFRRFVEREVADARTLPRGAWEALLGTAVTLSRLIRERKDTIYAFVIKNVYRPNTIGRVDVLMGNPPWLSYRFVKLPDYQEGLKKMIIQDYKLLPAEETKLLTHMELATLFFARCADVYLKNGGKIGFVMPRSIFTADNHDNFRRNAFKPSVSFDLVADFERTQSDRLYPLFSVESCAIIGTKGSQTRYPLTCLQMVGSLRRKNLRLADFLELRDQGQVKVNERKIQVIQIGERTSWSYELDEDLGHLAGRQSPYMERFRQGATLVPRPLWFVRPVSHPSFGIDPNAPFVESTENSLRMAKGVWRKARLQGRVESPFVYATLLGGDIFPFCHLPFRMVVLPVVLRDGYKTVSSKELSNLGFAHMRRWMAEAELAWNRGRAAKAERMSLTQRLDYQRTLSQQDPNARLLVLYNTSGRKNLSSSVVEIPEELRVHVNDQEFQASGFIAESSTYYASAASREEGIYCASCLNSSHTFELLRRIKAARHIHKKVWELPFPSFDPEFDLHREVVQKGQSAALVAREEMEQEIERYPNPDDLSTGQIGSIRRKVREAIGEPLLEMDDLIRELLMPSDRP